MTDILTLYSDLENVGVRFFHWMIPDRQAVTVEVNGQIGIFMDFAAIGTTTEEKIAVAHEGGHILTGSLHKLSSPYDLIRRHEIRADKWAINKLVPKDELEAAVNAGRTELWELAEEFGITVDFMKKAVHYYKYGNLAV